MYTIRLLNRQGMFRHVPCVPYSGGSRNPHCITHCIIQRLPVFSRVRQCIRFIDKFVREISDMFRWLGWRRVATCRNRRLEKVFGCNLHRKSLLTGAFSLQVSEKCTELHRTVFLILIIEKYSKFVRENKTLALGVCFLQPGSSAGCMFAADRSRLDCWRNNWLISIRTDSMKRCVN